MVETEVLMLYSFQWLGGKGWPQGRAVWTGLEIRAAVLPWPQCFSAYLTSYSDCAWRPTQWTLLHHCTQRTSDRHVSSLDMHYSVCLLHMRPVLTHRPVLISLCSIVSGSLCGWTCSHAFSLRSHRAPCLTSHHCHLWNSATHCESIII